MIDLRTWVWAGDEEINWEAVNQNKEKEKIREDPVGCQK